MNDIARILPSDEGLNHQIAQTFASVVHPDLSWTEKVWATIARKDGSLQVDFGLGKYLNRGVMDAFGGISRNREQWTVRGSRELAADPERSEVGPLRYEVLDPFSKVRVLLEENKIQPISFDLTFECILPPFFEDRHLQRDSSGFRVISDVVRYHQAGTVSGWIRLDGQVHTARPDEWFAFRDHSWGIRSNVGVEPTDIRSQPFYADTRFHMHWSPMVLSGPDGRTVEIHSYYLATGDEPFYASAYVNKPDGSQERIIRTEPELSYDPDTRMLTGGAITFHIASGEKRRITVTPAGETGFHLGTGLYLGFDGFFHGMWRGPLHLDGEYIADCRSPDVLPRIHQVRDRPVIVSDGAMHGFGIVESTITGAWPGLGLSVEKSYL